jgi:hypothetical protein
MSNTAKKAAGNAGKTKVVHRDINKPMRVTIPAGFIFTQHGIDDKVYVISDGKWPDALAIMFKEAQAKSYDDGYAAGKYAATDKQLAGNSCGQMVANKEPETVAREVLQVLNQCRTHEDTHTALQIIIRQLRRRSAETLQGVTNHLQHVKREFEQVTQGIADFENIVGGSR